MLVRNKKWLLALFRQVHELQADPVNKRMLALHIQEALLQRIGRAERLIRRAREENKLLKQRLAQRGTDREIARKAKARLLISDETIQRQKTMISVLRSIGDSIAFIYGDRWDLKQLVMKQDSGFISGKHGTRLERKILRKAFEAGATVVMNDLTHTLRHGDITVFRPDLWPDGGSPFLLVEVKSGGGGNRARMARQKAAVNRVSSYLSTDRRDEEGGRWQRVSVYEPPRHHFEAATRMMVRLPHGGWLLEEVEPGLHYALIDCAYKGNYRTIFHNLFNSKRVLFMLNVNDAKDQQLGYYPFPLCIRNAESLFRFYNGDFVMFLIIDLGYANTVLAPHGLGIEFSQSDEYPFRIFAAENISSAYGDSYVGFHPIGRLAAEFLRLDWFLENMIVGNLRSAISIVNKSTFPID